MTSQAYGSFDGRTMKGYDSGPASARVGSSDHSLLRSGDLGGRLRTKVNIWELILVPWLFLVLVLICYLLGGAHGKPLVLWLMPVVLLALCGVFLRHQYKAGNNAEVVLGLLCVTAVVIGLLIGVHANLKSLQEYHRLSQGASYFNVLPSEPAAGKLDATTLDFTNTSQVDTERAYGFVDIRSRNAATYCIAPVSDGDDLTNTRIEYFVAGTDCCGLRNDFQCGDLASSGAHGALVLPQAMQSDDMFKQAVSGAAYAYGLTVGDRYLLLHWKDNPVGYRNGLWDNTLILFLIFGGVYLVISAMIGCALMPVITAK